MVELWVPITIAAAFLQNARSALQKSLKAELSNNGATYVRFVFGAPFAAVYLALLLKGLDRPLPGPGTAFFLYAGLGGLAAQRRLLPLRPALQRVPAPDSPNAHAGHAR